jgi:hypothetical protein
MKCVLKTSLAILLCLFGFITAFKIKDKIQADLASSECNELCQPRPHWVIKNNTMSYSCLCQTADLEWVKVK